MNSHGQEIIAGCPCLVFTLFFLSTYSGTAPGWASSAQISYHESRVAALQEPFVRGAFRLRRVGNPMLLHVPSAFIGAAKSSSSSHLKNLGFVANGVSVNKCSVENECQGIAWARWIINVQEMSSGIEGSSLGCDVTKFLLMHISWNYCDKSQWVTSGRMRYNLNGKIMVSSFQWLPVCRGQKYSISLVKEQAGSQFRL